MLGIHYSAQTSFECGRREKRAAGANPGKPSEDFTKKEAVHLLHLLLLQQPLLACASDGSWLPRNLLGLWEHSQTILGQGTVMCTSAKPSGGKECCSAEVTSSTSCSIFHFCVMMRYNRLADKTQPWLTSRAGPVTFITEPLEMGSPVELHSEESRGCSNSTHLLRSCHSHQDLHMLAHFSTPGSHLSLVSVAPVAHRTPMAQANSIRQYRNYVVAVVFLPHLFPSLSHRGISRLLSLSIWFLSR